MLETGYRAIDRPLSHTARRSRPLSFSPRPTGGRVRPVRPNRRRDRPLDPNPHEAGITAPIGGVGHPRAYLSHAKHPKHDQCSGRLEHVSPPRTQPQVTNRRNIRNMTGVPGAWSTSPIQTRRGQRLVREFPRPRGPRSARGQEFPRPGPRAVVGVGVECHRKSFTRRVARAAQRGRTGGPTAFWRR